jgi:superfamily II DNA/RNA helicase
MTLNDLAVERAAFPATDTLPTDDVVSGDTVAQPAEAPEPAGPTFAQLGLPQLLVTALERRGIRHPFAIQASALPDALAGRDVLGKAATGSGKTLAFGLPMLTRLAEDVRRGPRAPRGLVLVPTRELAQQVSDNLAPLGQSLGLFVSTVYGGAPMHRQIQQLRRGVDVVIATPGRLLDLLRQGEAKLSEISVTVLDEADFMADLGFLPDVTELLDQTDPAAQRLLFSATLDGEVDTLVRRYLKDPARHEVKRPGDEAPPAEHRAYSIAFRDKVSITKELAARPGRTLVFARTQLGVDRLTEHLLDAGVKAQAIHGGLPQGARRRAMEDFTDARTPVLVATDVAARGIHVDDVSLVLHYDPPADTKTYLHRSGRTARAGASGVVVSLLLPDQVGQAKRRFRQAKVDPSINRLRPGDTEIDELVASGVHVEPKERPAREPRRSGGRRPRPDGGYRGGPRRSYGERGERSFGDRPRRDDRPYGDRPHGERPRRDDRPRGERTFGDRPQRRDDRPYGERGGAGDRRPRWSGERRSSR